MENPIYLISLFKSLFTHFLSVTDQPTHLHISISNHITIILPHPTPYALPSKLCFSLESQNIIITTPLSKLSRLISMAVNTFQSTYHNHHSTTHDIPPSTTTLFLKPTHTTVTSSPLSSHHHLHSLVISSTKTFSVSPTTSFSTPSSSPSSSKSNTFDLLQQHLSAQNFREADEETRRLLIVLAGEAAQKRGYVFFSEVQFIPEADLKAIDDLWRQHSNNRFGYSVQKRIFFEKVNQDFTNFFIKVGWMKKLDTEVDQYNYRAFPNEFIWELNDDTPEGHLPLTNALRGTQLLKCVLNHPAFKNTEEEEERLLQAGRAAVEGNKAASGGGLKGLMDGSKPLNKRVLESDYSF